MQHVRVRCEVHAAQCSKKGGGAPYRHAESGSLGDGLGNLFLRHSECANGTSASYPCRVAPGGSCDPRVVLQGVQGDVVSTARSKWRHKCLGDDPYQCLCHVEALSRVAVKEAKQEGLPCL